LIEKFYINKAEMKLRLTINKDKKEALLKELEAI